MSGKGKGKGGVERKTSLRDNILGVTKPAVRRLARRGGTKRIAGDVYEAARERLRAYLARMVANAVVYMDYARRKTVTAKDVVYACKCDGQALYGFE